MSEKLQEQCLCDTHRVFQVIIQRFILQDSIAKELYKPAVAIDMGMCFPCFKSSSTDLVTPDVVMSVSVFTEKIKKTFLKCSFSNIHVTI
jgi:hypothetical protein